MSTYFDNREAIKLIEDTPALEVGELEEVIEADEIVPIINYLKENRPYHTLIQNLNILPFFSKKKDTFTIKSLNDEILELTNPRVHYIVYFGYDLWWNQEPLDKLMIVDRALMSMLPVTNEKTGKTTYRVVKPEFTEFGTMIRVYGIDGCLRNQQLLSLVSEQVKDKE